MGRIKGLAILAGIGLLALTGPLRAGNIPFGTDPVSMLADGSFNFDNDSQSFTFSLDQQGFLNVQTTSFADGGGFAPNLTLFNTDTGAYITQDDGGLAPNDCATRGIVTGEGCLDALISMALGTGHYTLILTETGNTANGPNISDGFFFQNSNDPNLTPCPIQPTNDFTDSDCLGYGPAPGAFYLSDGTEQTSFWALSGSVIISTPEPASFFLLSLGLLVSGILFGRSGLPFARRPRA